MLHINEWCKISSDKEVISAIKGYKIPFKCIPTQVCLPTDRQFSSTEIKACSLAIEKLLRIKAISKVKPLSGQFVSPVFTVPKKDGTYRFILNLKILNEYIVCPHFKLEDHRTVTKLIFQNAWMAKIDLEDAYYMVSVHKSHRKYLRFMFEKELYQYNCLPFGLCTAPRLFTKIMRPVITLLRSQGFLSNIYLDDLLLIGLSYANCQENVNQTVSLLKRLGLRVNMKKSQLVPSQNIEYLGFCYCSKSMTISLPVDKKNRIHSMTKGAMARQIVNILEVSKLIGVLISASPAVNYSMIHTKVLELDKLRSLLVHGSYSGHLVLSSKSCEELNWWHTRILDSVMPIYNDNFKYEIETDSSKSGWGAFSMGKTTRGFWSFDESKYHINVLELLAIRNGLQSLLGNAHDCQILVRVDNTTALSYVNRQGGCRSWLCLLQAKDIWNWAESKGIHLVATYINTKDNIRADKASRELRDENDFGLDKSTFNKITQRFFNPDIDLFASSLTTKCAKYCSWYPDPMCTKVDAFSFKWPDKFYAFPPFSLIDKALAKIRFEMSTGIIVVPYWKSQAWYPMLEAMRTSPFYILSPSEFNLICPYRNDLHPMSNTLSLVVAVVSGKRWQCQMEQ